MDSNVTKEVDELLLGPVQLSETLSEVFGEIEAKLENSYFQINVRYRPRNLGRRGLDCARTSLVGALGYSVGSSMTRKE